MNISENICPACKKNNKPEAIVCEHCGAELELQTKTTNMPAAVLAGIENWSVDEAAIPEHGIAVYIEGEFKPAYINSNAEFVIGRRVDATTEVPQGLFDLSPLGGYAQGLSRRHVVIRRAEHGYEIFDPGSANGTWLDDQKLVPNKVYPLASGSHLRLGNMRLFVLYRPFAEAK